jgi:hypothetical protein
VYRGRQTITLDTVEPPDRSIDSDTMLAGERA